MEKKISIAIDGPAGAGKSTIARRLAKELGYYYVDTGAIYRTVAYFFDLWGISPKDADGIRRYIDELNITMEYDEEGVQHMIMNGMDVTGDIRTQDISQKASLVSAQPLVRDLLLEMQREVARKHNVIMDGRDIGTVVLPKATVKIFLTATPEIRAQRRTKELAARGEKADYARILREIQQRDYQDTHREIAPLKMARDSVKVDTSQMIWRKWWLTSGKLWRRRWRNERSDCRKCRILLRVNRAVELVEQAAKAGKRVVTPWPYYPQPPCGGSFSGMGVKVIDTAGGSPGW